MGSIGTKWDNSESLKYEANLSKLISIPLETLENRKFSDNLRGKRSKLIRLNSSSTRSEIQRKFLILKKSLLPTLVATVSKQKIKSNDTSSRICSFTKFIKFSWILCWTIFWHVISKWNADFRSSHWRYSVRTSHITIYHNRLLFF